MGLLKRGLMGYYQNSEPEEWNFHFLLSRILLVTQAPVGAVLELPLHFFADSDHHGGKDFGAGCRRLTQRAGSARLTAEV